MCVGVSGVGVWGGGGGVWVCVPALCMHVWVHECMWACVCVCVCGVGVHSGHTVSHPPSCSVSRPHIKTCGIAL